MILVKDPGAVFGRDFTDDPFSPGRYWADDTEVLAGAGGLMARTLSPCGARWRRMRRQVPGVIPLSAKQPVEVRLVSQPALKGNLGEADIGLSISVRARAMRLVMRYACGDLPKLRRKTLHKRLTLSLAAAARSSTPSFLLRLASTNAFTRRICHDGMQPLSGPGGCCGVNRSGAFGLNRAVAWARQSSARAGSPGNAAAAASSRPTNGALALFAAACALPLDGNRCKKAG